MEQLWNNESKFDRDREYWNRYYSASEGKLSLPSNFATFVSDYLSPKKHLLELGCGNGRDSAHFLKLGLRVTGIDASDYIIAKLNSSFFNNKNANFICEDFVKFLPKNEMRYDYIYSRFTLHAISEIQEDHLLNNIKQLLKNQGLFFIEARTIRDSLYGLGKRVNKNAYIYDDHYRRFIDANEFKLKLRKLEFEIAFFEERNGFSKIEASDPVLLRCIAQLKKGTV